MKFVCACLLLIAPLAVAEDNADAALDDWAEVLERYVDDAGRTDFRALAADRAALDRYVTWLAGHGPRTTPADYASPPAVLAYYINAYNALAMHGVLERRIPADFSSFFKRASFFRFRDIRIDGRDTNLYDLENDVIRPLRDARVHFALNCMVRSCPRLPRTPFRSDTLDADLEHLTREFFADRKHLVIDPGKRTIAVSAILDFYTEDFVASGRAEDLPIYINLYRDSPLPADYRLEFLDYDWRINQQP